MTEETLSSTTHMQMASTIREPEIDEPKEGMQRIALLLGYHGGKFRGFAYNVGVETVEGRIVPVLNKFFHTNITIAVGGRTDAGVHAMGQVISCDVPEGRKDLHRLPFVINCITAPDIVVREVVVTPPDFHARFSAQSRMYRYTIETTPLPDPLESHRVWHIRRKLDVEAMQIAAQAFVGLHDFRSFCRCRAQDNNDMPLFRRVHRAEWIECTTGRLYFEIEAKAFCQQMVRNIVGTLVGVGKKKYDPEDIPAMLAALRRDVTGQTAPPEGLCLEKIVYPIPLWQTNG